MRIARVYTYIFCYTAFRLKACLPLNQQSSMPLDFNMGRAAKAFRESQGMGGCELSMRSAAKSLRTIRDS